MVERWRERRTEQCRNEESKTVVMGYSEVRGGAMQERQRQRERKRERYAHRKMERE